MRTTRAGPYLLGPEVRSTARGVVHLATHPDHDPLLELEHYTELADAVRDDPDGRLMLDLALVSTIEHRHVAAMAGVGLLDDAPYVVRPHVPGRALDEVLQRGPLEPETALGVLYAVAEALGYLAEEGPQPGACSMGGLDPDDVLLGFGGAILLVGTGLSRVRKDEAGDDGPALARFAAQLIDPADLPEPGLAPAVWARALRKSFPEACGRRAERVARGLRARFAESIDSERENLGLPPIH